MEFTRAQEIEALQEEAVSRLKQVLKQHGFDQTAEIRASKAGEGDGQPDGAGTLVTAYNSQLSSRALEIAPEAALLLTSTFLVRQSGERSQVGVLDPEVLSIIPERQELQSVVEEMRTRVARVLDDVTNPQQEDTSAASAEQVEQRLYGLILQAIDAVSKGDPAQSSDQIFVLAKAYTAVASLKRTEEIELHLAYRSISRLGCGHRAARRSNRSWRTGCCGSRVNRGASEGKARRRLSSGSAPAWPR